MRNPQFRKVGKMTMIRPYVFGAALLLLVVCVSSSAWAVETKQAKAVFSAIETKGDGGSDWTLSWNFDGEWLVPGKARSLAITVDSDYSKSDTAKLDHLRTGFRTLGSDYGNVMRRWYPVFLIQTEGDHGLDSIHTLVAAGYRQQRRYGFLELTGGMSKDIRLAEGWVGDIGAQIGYERQLGSKWKFSTGPKGEFGALGEVRLRRDRFRYSWDVALDYQATEKLGLGYRLWYGNTVPNSRRTQWIGLSYSFK